MFTLRPYQEELLTKLHNAWASTDKGGEGKKAPCIVSPCGSGKSVIAAEIARRTTSNGKRVLFLVHRKELCDQIRETFTKGDVDMSLCDVMMVQTATRRTNKLQKPELIITDENHHCVATTYRKIYDTFPDAYKVGLSATPIRINGDGLGDVNDKLIEGKSVQWLIDNKCLSQFRLFSIPVINRKDLKTRQGDFTTESIDNAMYQSDGTIDKTIAGNVIENYIEKGKRGKAICYCHSIEFSKDMEREFLKNGILAKHIDGNTPKQERDETIQKFRDGEIMVLLNVDLISEGFDVPDCEVAILLRPTKSLVLYTQQSMRCMRYKEGKQAIILDHAGNARTFGLPTTEHDWSLEKKEKKKKDIEQVQLSKICEECGCENPIDEIKCQYCGGLLEYKKCDKCGCKNRLESRECKECGYVFPVMPRELVINDDIKLQEITEFKQELLLKNCKSIEDLERYRVQKNYKSGWIVHQAFEKGFEIDYLFFAKLGIMRNYKYPYQWAEKQVANYKKEEDGNGIRFVNPDADRTHNISCDDE